MFAYKLFDTDAGFLFLEDGDHLLFSEITLAHLTVLLLGSSLSADVIYATAQLLGVRSHTFSGIPAAAVDKHLKLSSYGTNINDATPMSQVIFLNEVIRPAILIVVAHAITIDGGSKAKNQNL